MKHTNSLFLTIFSKFPIFANNRFTTLLMIDYIIVMVIVIALHFLEKNVTTKKEKVNI